jgi:hypothetical protein
MKHGGILTLPSNPSAGTCRARIPVYLALDGKQQFRHPLDLIDHQQAVMPDEGEETTAANGNGRSADTFVGDLASELAAGPAMLGTMNRPFSPHLDTEPIR